MKNIFLSKQVLFVSLSVLFKKKVCFSLPCACGYIARYAHFEEINKHPIFAPYKT